VKYKHNPVLRPDQPWERQEGLIYPTGCVMYDDEERIFKMWYEVVDYSWYVSMLAYATSEDGIHWEKPDTGFMYPLPRDWRQTDQHSPTSWRRFHVVRLADRVEGSSRAGRKQEIQASILWVVCGDTWARRPRLTLGAGSKVNVMHLGTPTMGCTGTLPWQPSTAIRGARTRTCFSGTPDLELMSAFSGSGRTPTP